ncbi:hypothetical protein F2Q69_00006389 [Brassica cretica]|uniref:Uncharacterized protein n=1 Tax=Brassica cretica TaxID=69181 RepID=A0A8S9PNS9_BRACR|nr:hypothetical protein F2Q69_00006389 [Brassica cretica]
MEDSLELEDFLKVLYEAQPEDLGKDSEQKLDDNQHTSGRDLETSPKASVQVRGICDTSIDRHNQFIVDRHPLGISTRSDKNKQVWGKEEEELEEEKNDQGRSSVIIDSSLRALLTAEMIYKGQESMEAFTKKE